MDKPKKAKIMVIGDGPGYSEDQSGDLFSSEPGLLLRKELLRVGITSKECYFTNVVKCRGPEGKSPGKLDSKVCASNFLTKEMELVDPDYVLLLGNLPLQALVGRSGITKYRGQTFGEEPLLFATFHPAYVSRSPQHLPTFKSDLSRFARMARGGVSEAEGSKVRIVRSVSGLRRLIKELSQAEVIAYDIETTGLEEWRPDAQIVSISFTTKPGSATVVPIHHVSEPWRNPDKVLQALKPSLERKDCKYVAHNGKFDCRWLAAKGIFVHQSFDTMLAAHLLDENRAKGLKPLSQILLGVDAYDVGVDTTDCYNQDLKKLCLYNGKDTDYTFRLYEIFKAELLKRPRLARIFARLMMPASNVLTQVETWGMHVHEEQLNAQYEELEARRVALDQMMRRHVPKAKRLAINFNSYAQVGEWLFNDLKLPILAFTASEAPSTAESVLLQLKNRHEAVNWLLELRGVVKKLGYLKSWREKLDDRSRIHTNYKLFGTVTGRLSSEKPNLQQVPREGTMRTCFGAPEGYLFLEADYSQVELRIAAMAANEPTLLRIFLTGGDPHLTTAADISRLTPDQVLESDKYGGTEYRKKAKGVNFGFLYGMGEEKFIDYARDSYGIVVSPEEAHEYRERYFRLYPKLLAWHDRQRRIVHRHGRVHSAIGRVRNLPDVFSPDRGVSAEAERQAINSPIQSLASDLMLLSAVQLSSRLNRSQAFIVASVHDALGFQVREDYVDKAVPIIRHTMEDMTTVRRLFGARITVPIKVEIKVGTAWGAGKVVE